MMFGTTVFGLLIGNPIAGALVIRSWLELQVFFRGCLAMGTVRFVAVRVVKDGIALRVWSWSNGTEIFGRVEYVCD